MRSFRPVVKAYTIFAIIGGIALGVSLLFGISPCPIFHITGLPCPACGMTRAFTSLFTLDFAGAFMWHPLFFVVPVLPWLMWERISFKRRNRIAIALIILFVGVWVVRMIFMFPHTPPMTFNENSLLTFFWTMI